MYFPFLDRCETVLKSLEKSSSAAMDWKTSPVTEGNPRPTVEKNS